MNDPAERFRRDDGAVVVEAAFVLPLLLLIVFGIFEFGYQYSVVLELRSAAREGGRLAATDNGCATSTTCPSAAQQLADLQQATKDRARGLGDRNKIQVSVCYPSGAVGGTNDVTVTLSYPKRSISGLFSPVLVGTLTSTAVMRLEQTPTFAKTAGATC